jgi:Mn2+/Fe2+ NRAMP family transporter
VVECPKEFLYENIAQDGGEYMSASMDSLINRHFLYIKKRIHLFGHFLILTKKNDKTVNLEYRIWERFFTMLLLLTCSNTVAQEKTFLVGKNRSKNKTIFTSKIKRK